MSFRIKTKKSLYIPLLMVVLLVVIAFLSLANRYETPEPIIQNIQALDPSDNYLSYLTAYEDSPSFEESIEINPIDFILDEGETLESGNSHYHWERNTSVSFEVDINNSGLYVIALNYQSLTDSVNPIQLEVFLNDDPNPPYFEASQITLDTLWQEVSEKASTDRYGNDVNVLQKPYHIWQETVLKDGGRLFEEGLKFYLAKGKNQITISKSSGDLNLGTITLRKSPKLIDYATYLTKHENQEFSAFHQIQAENMHYKNSSTIIQGTSRDVGVEPFSLLKLKLNVVGVDSYHVPGNSATWIANVEKAGFYQITVKALQSRQNTTSYRTLYINGKIPFEEARHIPFSYRNKWQNITLSSLNQEPFLFYLEPGDEITLSVDSTLFTKIYHKLKEITNEMTELGLNVTKITRNNTDKGIDWDMLAYFPDLYDVLARWETELTEIITCLKSLFGFKRDSQMVVDFKAAISKIQKIASDINELPRRLVLLSQGTSCAVQLIANQIDNVIKQPLTLDAIYLHTPDQMLPKANGSFFEKAKVSIARFVMSFFDSSYKDKAEAGELEVWVNRSRQYVDLIQKITDDVFTDSYGIKVKVSIMSDDGKLILANSAGRAPDVALGVSAWIPNEYGMRGMLYDLTKQPDFKDVIKVYHPEQLIPMIYDEHLYGLPETENFYVLFYRKDILSKLGLTVPNTWNDVLDMLPFLERYGMSFYVPLSNNASNKSFDTTAPFIFQFEGKLYHESGFKAAVDDEKTIQALTFMTDLYREYSMPYQVPSFFNSFRDSTIPIGVADFGTYLQLMNAASEISGLWEIAIVPGIEHKKIDSATGEEITYINRSMPGAQQAGIIFEKSDKIDQAWTFLKWWLSTDTQKLFSETIVNTLGSRYLWNSANLEAFQAFNWKEEHKQVILSQWQHLKEVPKIPGSYLVEREISNTWNKVVFNDANLRSTISDALIKMNKEIKRKMKEFDYLTDQEEVIRPFSIPSVEIVKAWCEDDEH